MNGPQRLDQFSRHASAAAANDLLASAFTEHGLASLDRRIEAIVARLLEERLPAEIERALLSPWLDTKHAAAYLGITENALRLRVREELVPTHRDSAGRLRFHRRELDDSMTAEPQRRRR